MIVFEYLYGMMDELGPRMDEYAKREVRLIIKMVMLASKRAIIMTR